MFLKNHIFRGGARTMAGAVLTYHEYVFASWCCFAALGVGGESNCQIVAAQILLYAQYQAKHCREPISTECTHSTRGEVKN